MTPSPAKIMHIVLETGSISGGVRVVGEIANRLAARGWAVKIWSIHEKQTMAWFDLSPRIEWISFLRTGDVADYDQLAIVLKKQPGYKLATFWQTAFAVQYASAPGEGLYLCQDIEVFYAAGPLMQAQVLATYELGLRHLTTSRWVASQLTQADYIGIGLDDYYKPLDHVTAASKKGRRARRARLPAARGQTPIACARRQALKGWRELCETAGYLAAAGHPIGTYGQDKKLSMFAQHSHIQNPPNKTLRDLYNGAACFFSTSVHEGLSLTPLEAMACGCPVVTTDAQGNMEYSYDGDNCLIATTPRDVADKVLRVLREPELAARLSKSGLATASTYRWPGVIDRLESFLQ